MNGNFDLVVEEKGVTGCCKLLASDINYWWKPCLVGEEKIVRGSFVGEPC